MSSEHAARYFAGIDLGGTKIATAIVDSALNTMGKITVPTLPEEGADAVIARMARSVVDVAAGAGLPVQSIAGVCIGSPGPLDQVAGVVVDAPNLGWKDVPVAARIRSSLSVPVTLENDANVAALAENRLGAGKGTRNMMYVTVSTGIGSGLILEGKLYRGASGAAGEFGHITVLPDGPLCGCGNRGCLEALASGTAIGKRGREAAQRPAGAGILSAASGKLCDINSHVVAGAADAGDPTALAIMRGAFEYLGTATANVVNLLNLEMVVIGGGVAQVGDILFDTIRQTVALRAFPFMASRCSIVPASLGTDAGVLGAACCAVETFA